MGQRMETERIEIVPIDFSEAQYFVQRHHRHHKPPIGHKFSVACSFKGYIVGVAIIGRPTSRMLDDGLTLEVTRLCTNGTKNTCSKLYSAAWRAARSLGYKRLITYTLQTEAGTSLIASGWKCLGQCGGGSWSRKDRPRVDKHPTQLKIRWEKS